MVGWTHFKQYSLEMVINPMADRINHLYRTMSSRSTSKCYADPTWKIAVSTQCFLVVKSSSPLHPKPTRFFSKTAIFPGFWVNRPKFPNLNLYLKFLAPLPTKPAWFPGGPGLRALKIWAHHRLYFALWRHRMFRTLPPKERHQGPWLDYSNAPRSWTYVTYVYMA